MLILYFQNMIIKMIQYKQKQQMHVIKQLMPVQNYTFLVRLKKDFLTYIRKTLLSSKYSISNSYFVVKITVHHTLTTVHKNKYQLQNSDDFFYTPACSLVDSPDYRHGQVKLTIFSFKNMNHISICDICYEK